MHVIRQLGIFQKVTIEPVNVNLFCLCMQERVSPCRHYFLGIRRCVLMRCVGEAEGGLFDGKTFPQLRNEDYKLLARTIKELIPAAHGPPGSYSHAQRLVSKLGFLELRVIWRMTRLCLQKWYCKLLFCVPPVSELQRVIPRENIHPSIIFFLTVFHYCFSLKKTKQNARMCEQ